MAHLVSIVMPVHNAGRYIEEAIRSVMQQTYQEWELLVVDDASTDASIHIARRLAAMDTRIKVLVNEHNTGYPATPRNKAIDAAQGRYIAFLDSDDMWLPHKLEQQLSFFGDDERVGVVFSNYEKVDEKSQRANRVVVAPSYTDYKHLLLGNVIGNVTGIYDTQRVGKVHFRKVRHEDYAMWLSILKRGFIAKNTGTVTALYRVTGDSVSARKMHLLSWQWNIYRRVEKLGFISSVYYYVNYAIRGLIKSFV